MEKSTGDAWFNMKAPEITEELKGDLKVLKMRGSLDPKRFYKKNDRDGFPKYFQVGKKLRVSDTLNVHICFRKKDILDSFSSNNFPSRFCSLLFYVILTGTMLWLSYTLSEPFYVCVWNRLVQWWTTQSTSIIPVFPRRAGRELWWRSCWPMPSSGSKLKWKQTQSVNVSWVLGVGSSKKIAYKQQLKKTISYSPTRKNKKKYQQIVAEKAAHGAGRRNNKKKKFRKK